MNNLKEKLINSLFEEKKSKKKSKFKFPLLRNGYDKKDLVEATKTLISRNLTMGKKTEKFENFFCEYICITRSYRREVLVIHTCSL